MPENNLHAPWRMPYIRSLAKPTSACFLCDAVAATTPEHRRDLLVLWTTDHSIVLINRYPYTNGHLLIAPKAHKADLEELTAAEQLDLQTQVAAGIALLKRAISPQGFNLGTNLGKCAGAGLPGHLHSHIVPRWSGDTNFMWVIGETRIVPQAMSQLYDELMSVRDKM